MIQLIYVWNRLIKVIALLFSNTSRMVRLSILTILSLLVLSQAQILAIDYGTQFVKAALVHTGAGKSFSIVENSKSQRKFVNALGIYNEERFYEADTLPKRSRGPSNCFIFSRLLIDLHDNPTQLDRVKKELILEYLQHPQSDQLMAEYILSGMPEGANTISLLQTFAMMIKYVKLEAQKQAKGPLKDVVLTVPSHWNLKQRKFLADAATLADLYVLSLIHQNTAAALNYALSQRATNNSEIVLFYNLGANSLQMTLAEFKQVKTEKTKTVESVFVLGDYGRSYVGGLSLDYLIADYFRKSFEEKYKKTLNQRGQIRMLAEAQKVKKVLSANKEASIFIEGLMDGIDFSGSMTRRQFEQMAEKLFQDVTTPIKRFLFDHDLKPSELTAVQLVGGGSRVPGLQALISEAVGNASIVGSHINGDEAMVFGAAFYGANSSKKFKVKGINLYDGFNFDIRIVLRNAQEGIDENDQRYYFKNATLFKKKNRFGLTKEVTFKCHQNLIVQLYKEDDTGVEILTSHAIESIKDINESNYKLSLTFEIHPLEVVRLQGVKYLYSKDIVQSYTEKVKKVVPKTQEQEEQESQEKTEEAEKTSQDDKEREQQANSDEEESKTENKTAQNKTKSQKKKKKEKIEYETVERTRNVTKKFETDLEFKQTYTISTQQDQSVVKRAKKHFSFFEAKEEMKKKLAESKNKLEALIYEVRERLEQEEFISYSQQSQRQSLETLYKEKSEWYDDTVSNNAEDYIREFKSLNDLLQKVKKRIVQHRERDTVFKRATSTIEDYIDQTKKLRKTKPWVTEEEVEDLSETLSEAIEKINKIHEQLKQTPINKDTIYRNKDMVKEADLVKDKFFALKGKSKPKGYKEEKQQGKTSEEKQQKEEKAKDQQVNQDQL